MLDLFEVEREGERDLFSPYKFVSLIFNTVFLKKIKFSKIIILKLNRKLHNRQLLWHGSRTTNFAGIIGQV